MQNTYLLKVIISVYIEMIQESTWNATENCTLNLKIFRNFSLKIVENLVQDQNNFLMFALYYSYPVFEKQEVYRWQSCTLGNGM